MKSEQYNEVGKMIKQLRDMIKSDPSFVAMMKAPDIWAAEYDGAVMDVLFEDYEAGLIQLTESQLERVTVRYLGRMDHLRKKLQV